MDKGGKLTEEELDTRISNIRQQIECDYRMQEVNDVTLKLEKELELLIAKRGY